MDEQKKTGTVTRAEFDALISENQELSMLIQEMAEDMHLMNSALLRNSGADPQVASRKNQKRKLVQFTKNYNRLPQPSETGKGPNLIDGYIVGAQEIVKIAEDEFDRITGDFPGLIVSKKADFVERMSFKTSPDKDAQGRFRWRVDAIPVSVDDLIKTAQEVG